MVINNATEIVRTFSFSTHNRIIQVAVYLKKRQTSRRDTCSEKQNTYHFYILLTVHHVMILG